MFGEEFEHDEHGWLVIPKDVQLRKEYFVGWKEAGLPADHPAKANLHLTRALINYTTEPGQRVMDVNAGSGSVLIGAVDGRDVTAIEIAPHFVAWMDKSWARMKKLKQVKSLVANTYILQGDCREYLPVPCQAVVFSPPYSQAMNSGGGILNREKELQAGIELYRYGGDKNLGNLPNFLYNKAMGQIYKGIWDSLETGGKLVILIKDRIKNSERINLGLDAVRMGAAVGFKVAEWVQWKPPGSMWIGVQKAQGHRVVEDEHIIILER